MTALKKVLIVNPNDKVVKMFKRHAWEIVDNILDADLVQLTGGADISPSLYGHEEHYKTKPNVARDRLEAAAVRYAIAMEIPVAGICRGAQLINAVCGGTLFQDADGHRGTHTAWDVNTEKEYVVTSRHHQLMDPSLDSEIVMVANESKRRLRGNIHGSVKFTDVHRDIRNFYPHRFTKLEYQKRALDIEACYYPKENAFCFQPHPEYKEAKALAALYMFYLDQYLTTKK